MNPWTRNESPRLLRALDCVFTQLGGNPPPEPEDYAGSSGQAAPQQEGAAAGALPLSEVQPPPKVETQADLQAAYDWLLWERKRLEGYTNAQLTRIQNEHAAMIAKHYTNEQVMILRTQELANKEDFLTRQTRGLQQEALQLADREKALAEQREQLCKLHEEFAALRESCTGVRRDADVQQALLETLRLETVAVQRTREQAGQDLEAMEKRLQEQQAGRADEQALYAARQAQLDQRCDALEKAEDAAQRRLAELDELEARLRGEIGEREKQLVTERAAVEALARQLRQRYRDGKVSPPRDGLTALRK
jgi:hypothetical protein